MAAAAAAITHSDTAARDRGNLSEFAAEGSQGGRHWEQLATLHPKSGKSSERIRASVELSSALHTVQNALPRERPPSQLRQEIFPHRLVIIKITTQTCPEAGLPGDFRVCGVDS